MTGKIRDLIITNLLAVLVGLLLSGIMLLFLRVNPMEVFSQSILDIITDKYLLGDVFLKATPLIFTGLAFAFTYKANLFNIGAQGQFYMGAIVAISSTLFLQDILPTPLLLIVVCVLTAIGGGLVGGIIGFLKAKYGANEFLVSMMSTYIVVAFMDYLLRTFLKESKGEYPQSDAISTDGWIPNLIDGTRLHWGFILAIVIAIGIWILLFKTPLGFRIRAVGSNARAAEVSGIKSRYIYIITFFISGALAGLAGFTEINGGQHMLIQDFNPTLGSAGIGIAILSNGNPIGIIFSSMLFGFLMIIGNVMGRMPGLSIPSSIIDLMLGFVMVFVIIAYFVREYLEISREKNKLKRGIAK